MGVGHKICPKVQGHKGQLWNYGIEMMVGKHLVTYFLSLPFFHAHILDWLQKKIIGLIDLMSIRGLFV
jgi:hypothetical protein